VDKLAAQAGLSDVLPVNGEASDADLENNREKLDAA
jgi:hypothetical protein